MGAGYIAKQIDDMMRKINLLESHIEFLESKYELLKKDSKFIPYDTEISMISIADDMLDEIHNIEEVLHTNEHTLFVAGYDTNPIYTFMIHKGHKAKELKKEMLHNNKMFREYLAALQQ